MTAMVQLAPAVSVVPQVVLAITNSLLFVPETAELVKLTVVVELLVMISTCGAGVELIATFPKASGVGEIVTLSRNISIAP